MCSCIFCVADALLCLRATLEDTFTKLFGAVYLDIRIVHLHKNLKVTLLD